MVSPPGRAGGPLYLLVCRANQARSPLAAALLSDLVERWDSRPRPELRSSGLYAAPDVPPLPPVADRLAPLGRADHRSRPFDPGEAADAALVVTFERAQQREVVRRVPDLHGRVFTLRELVRLSSAPQWDPAWNASDGLADRLHRMRPRTAGGDDDTPDPAGVGTAEAGRVLDSVEEDVRRAAPVLLGGPGQPAAAAAAASP